MGNDIQTENGSRSEALFRNAQSEANKLGHNLIGTEMLLLAVMEDTSSPAGDLLKSFGVTREDMRAKVESTAGRGIGQIEDEIRFTPRSERVLDIGRKAAADRNQEFGAEHVLLALIMEGGGAAVNILRSLLKTELLQSELLTLLEGIPRK